MLSAQIRQSFLDFFAGLDHKVLPSSSLIPHEDPSVLLTTAGMQQFKAYFRGQAQPPAPRVVTVQKSFRTVDLDEVGDDSHLTFFEMLGNFSFGDYFKQEAIEWAWQYLTVELGIDAARLQPTVYTTDDDSDALWRRVSGKVPVRLEDNWWGPTGPAGPCGPDSEIHFDWGTGVGCGQTDCYPGHCDRYLEVWNLVFNEFDQAPDGSRVPLAKQGVDTGMGLERLAAVLGGHRSVHDTDIFSALRRRVLSVAEARGVMVDDPRVEYSARLVADHARGTAFLVADGVRPGNEGRGYVLRRMIRRANRHSLSRLGGGGLLSETAGDVVELMGDAYPELVARLEVVRKTLQGEEEAFERTLAVGEKAFAELAGRSHGIIDGAEAFKLHDTYGFPIELTMELASERGLTVDREGFDAALAEQRQQGRRSVKRAATERTGLTPTEFVGYDSLAATAGVTRLFRGAEEVREAVEGDDVEVYLDRSPMYAEGGGQVGDVGVLEGPAGSVEVRDVQRQGDAFAHYGRVASGRLAVGDEVRAAVDADARWATMRHHSATHLLHRALREVLGQETHQAGSYVAPDSCSFDFTFNRAPTAGELDAVFSMVNRAVREDLVRQTREMALEEARQGGAMMLFGEKYGERVRVVNFGDFSIELCGGTHVDRSGQLGVVAPVAEKSVGAGLRRLEFLAGAPAERHLKAQAQALQRAASALRVAPADVGERTEALVAERKELLKQVDELKRRALAAPATGANGADRGFRNGVTYQVIDGEEAGLAREVADRLLDHDSTAQLALVLARDASGTARAVVKARRGGGVSAGVAFERIRGAVGGKGGGNETLAQGGGFNVKDMDRILEAAEAVILEHGTAADGA